MDTFDLSRFHTLDSLLQMTPPPLTWDVEGFLATNERCVLYGEFGSMKSWLLMGLTLSLAAGVPWMGHFATAPRSVLYIDEENSKRTSIRRFQRLHVGLGSPPLVKPVQIASRVGIKAGRGLSDRLRATLDALSFCPDVIIFETLRRVLVGSEVDQTDISAFWDTVTQIAGDTKSIIVAHHMRKASQTNADEHARDRASGSTDILAGCDVGYAVHRIKAGHIKVECVKSREVEEPSPFGVILDAPDTDGPAKLAYHDEKMSEHEQSIYNFIASQQDETASTALIEVYCKERGIARATMFRHLRNLIDQARITNPIHGVYKASILILPE